MGNQFYSNGKLLLTAEYAILDGAQGLALPTKFGQSLKLKTTDTETLDWVSLNENDETWFSAKFSRSDLKAIQTTNPDMSNRLTQILLEAKKLNPNFLSNTPDYNTIETKLTFPRDWGLGSSSTLIANIAHWADVNPYRLLEATFGGSGYDIACATYNTPILYQRNLYKPVVRSLEFKPSFSDRLFFIYLNQKKNSREAIKAYRKLDLKKSDFISKIDEITQQIIRCTSLSEFEVLLNLHERIISNTLHIPTVKELLFIDYHGGSIKSLGAWGGDFIMATGNYEAMEYFKKKGFTTILSYNEIIL